MSKNVICPYCSAGQGVPEHGDYRPYYVDCTDCTKRFIVEPVSNGTLVYKLEEAPCCSDPDCRAIEMGLGDD